MFLSRLSLNLRDRQARLDLARPYEMHRSLWKAFPDKADGGAGRVLFRVDTDRWQGKPMVVVQSHHEPNWSVLPSAYLTRSPEWKPLELDFVNGQQLRFRLRANPTKRVAAKDERLGGTMTGKRVGLITETEQVRWLLRKGEAGGFRIPGSWVDTQHPETGKPIQLPNFRIIVVPEGWDRNGKPGSGGQLFGVRFDGVLEVINPVGFRETLAAGVGSAKGFGFGLLSVARTER